jgi:hypothetical protein
VIISLWKLKKWIKIQVLEVYQRRAWLILDSQVWSTNVNPWLLTQALKKLPCNYFDSLTNAIANPKSPGSLGKSKA